MSGKTSNTLEISGYAGWEPSGWDPSSCGPADGDPSDGEEADASATIIDPKGWDYSKGVGYEETAFEPENQYTDDAPAPEPSIFETAVDVIPAGNLLVKLISDHPTNPFLKLQVMATVSSDILRLASPVFDRMLNKNYPLNSIKPKKDGQEKDLIELYDDNPTAMLVILHTMHMVPEQVPKALTQEQLLGVAYATDKYDCAQAMYFAASGWIRNLEDAYESKDESIGQSWVFIAETFGLGEGTLKKMVEIMKQRLENTARKREESYWHLLHNRLDDEFIRKDMLDAILKARQDEINKIFKTLSVCREFFGPTYPGREAVRLFRQIFETESSFYYKHDPCRAKALEDLEKAIRAQGLSTWLSGRRSGKDPSHWMRCLQTLQRKVENIILRHDKQKCMHFQTECPIKLMCNAKKGLLKDTSVEVDFTWNPRRKDTEKEVKWETFGDDDDEEEEEEKK